MDDEAKPKRKKSPLEVVREEVPPPTTEAAAPVQDVTPAAPTPLKTALLTSTSIEDAVSDDPFALSKLRLPQNFLATTKVKKLMKTVPVGRPSPQTFFRVHPAPAYRESMAFLELKDEREIYLVDLEQVPELESECYGATLYTCMTRGGVLFMWPVRLITTDGRALDWHVSAADAAQAAMTSWIRIKSNMQLRAYDIFEAEGVIPDPKWPEMSYKAIYTLAFKTRLINTLDHPVIKHLRGE